MKQNRVGIVDVVLVGGAGTGNWRDPEEIRDGSPTQIELEYAPDIIIPNRTVAGGTAGHLVVTATAKTVTIASSSGTDTGTIRVVGICRAADMGA